MNPRWLGIIGMLGAPFLLLDFIMHGIGSAYVSTSLSGIFSLLYISGWMCSVIGMWKLQATGNNRPGRSILILQLFFLTLANVSNIWAILQPGVDTRLYFILDLFWPVSNAFMLVTAVAIISAGQWKGWTRYVPLVVGLWLPFSLFILKLLFDMSPVTMIISGAYSTIAWMALGFAVVHNSRTQTFSKAFAY